MNEEFINGQKRVLANGLEIKGEKEMSMFGVMNHLDVVVCEDADEAIAQGYIYRSPIAGVEIEKVVVVKNGTHGNNSTVDLLMRDEHGNQYVVMVTGALLKSIPC